MSTYEPGGPPAVAAADAATTAWETAVRHQQTAPAAHSDFYALAGDITLGLNAVQALARELHRQVIHYRRVPGLYDDSRGQADAVDPQVRLARAADHLDLLADTLGSAIRHANEFWSAIGHIGVDVDRPTGGDGSA